MTDLQDPPELIELLVEPLDEGADVVFGKCTSREAETWFTRTTASAFYRLLTHLTKVAIPRDTGDFRLMSRRVVDALAMPERQRSIRGMVSWIGGRRFGRIEMTGRTAPAEYAQTKSSILQCCHGTVVGSI